MKYVTLGTLGVIVLVAFFVLAPTGGMGFPGSESNSSGVRQRAELNLTPTEVFRDIEGDVDLRLSNRGENAARLKASATAEGEGIIDDAFYSLCVDDLFIDADRAKEPLDNDDDDEVANPESENDDEAEAELEAELEPSPLSDLSGLTVTIRLGIGCHGHIVLHGVVTQLD